MTLQTAVFFSCKNEATWQFLRKKTTYRAAKIHNPAFELVSSGPTPMGADSDVLSST
jgi:hypothetical protein